MRSINLATFTALAILLCARPGLAQTGDEPVSAEDEPAPAGDATAPPETETAPPKTAPAPSADDSPPADAEPAPPDVAPKPADAEAGSTGAAAAPPAAGPTLPFVQVRLIMEIGGLAPVAHTIKFSKDGTRFDYIEEGGQNNVFFFWRPTAELTLDRAHTLILLYQPLNLESRVYLERDVRVDGAVFPAGSGLDLRYGFDFYRLSYLYDFFGESARDELSLGLSLQMRNATIDFTSTDGSVHRSNRDIGPVPAIKLRGRWAITPRAWIGGEADAIYAPVKYINGSNSDVEGAFFDLSLRAGYLVVRSLDVFVNLRYIGGGAEGTGSADDGPGDGYTSNWLHFLTFSVGAAWAPTDL